MVMLEQEDCFNWQQLKANAFKLGRIIG